MQSINSFMEFDGPKDRQKLQTKDTEREVRCFCERFLKKNSRELTYHGKRKIIFKSALVENMLVSRRVRHQNASRLMRECRCLVMNNYSEGCFPTKKDLIYDDVCTVSQLCHPISLVVF